MSHSLCFWAGLQAFCLPVSQVKIVLMQCFDRLTRMVCTFLHVTCTAVFLYQACPSTFRQPYNFLNIDSQKGFAALLTSMQVLQALQQALACLRLLAMKREGTKTCQCRCLCLASARLACLRPLVACALAMRRVVWALAMRCLA